MWLMLLIVSVGKNAYGLIPFVKGTRGRVLKVA
ncbi:hypothetical protein SAG0123_02005 [Streptococcus agalactiae STIR-CD-13]|nr:hypothetical protein SAG0123_02005 [Streptococcus agalactiae STIR-CD-13]